MDDAIKLPVVIDETGVPRKLAALPPRPNFGGFKRFASVNGLIPRTQWAEVSMAHLAGDVWDQGQHGSCVGHGSTKAFEIAYRMAGGTVPDSGFSPTSLYALVNGGRDDGAVVSDAMDALINGGVATMAEVPESIIFASQIPASADATRKRFRVADAFHCTTFDAIGSALMLGFPVSFGIMIRAGFNRPNADGTIPDGGRVLGGHCLCAYGTKLAADGSWQLRVRNSWNTSWGLDGDCFLDEWAFDHGGDLDAFAIRASQSDPMDPNLQPAAN